METGKGEPVAITSDRLDRKELVSVTQSASEPQLRALEVAIFVEESLGLILPDEVLDASHLGTPEAAVATVDNLFPDH